MRTTFLMSGLVVPQRRLVLMLNPVTRRALMSTRLMGRMVPRPVASRMNEENSRLDIFLVSNVKPGYRR